MAGLIQQNMAAPQGEPTEGQLPMGAAEESSEGPNPDTDPAYQQAIGLVMQALYGEKAANGVAESLKSAPSITEGLANVAYEITSIIDERTEGAVPDELIALLATAVLEEVAEIADAAGLKVSPAETAVALKQMILRFLGEQGVDTTQLQQAMDQVNPDDFNRMAEGEQANVAEPVEGEEMEG